ncbi:MAG: hypothetical protein MRY32_01495 [Rickettsiales bacterium]|nr:hypothetical protein [Rickettsiales bacterium]
MQAFRQDMLPMQSQSDRAAQMTFQPASFSNGQNKPVGDTITQNAVQAADDSTELSPLAEKQAELQAIIDRLSSATTALDVEEALRAVQDFAEDNTNENMIGTAIGQLAEMADAAMEAIQSDPGAIGGAFSFEFNANFSQRTIQTEDAYVQKTSFSFSFSFETPNTVMEGNMSFRESYKENEDGFSYKSNEKINVRMVTLNANMETNPAVEAFNKLTEAITGVDASSLFEPLPAPEPVAAEPQEQQTVPIGVTEPYFPISAKELLQMKFEHLAIAHSSHHRLMFELSQFTKTHMKELQAA